MVFVGLDWASTAHAVCILDDTGTVQWRGSVPHSAEGLAELVRQLRQFGPPATVRVAIERPSGVVIDTLIDAGVQVVPIHPNVVKASRARYAAAHPKSDDGDRDLLADLLRTDGHRFRPLRPPDNVVVLPDCDNPRLDGDLVGVDLGAHFGPRISPSKISSVSGKVARGSVDLKSREARP